MYYPSSENKGADQLRGYPEADLRLCFRLCRLLVFSRGGSFLYLACYYEGVNARTGLSPFLSNTAFFKCYWVLHATMYIMVNSLCCLLHFVRVKFVFENLDHFRFCQT